MLAKRYRDNPTVVGADLHNEPHGDGHLGHRRRRRPTGGSPPSGPATRSSAANPNWLIVVEGIEA